MKKIKNHYFVDTTLRDGEQTAGVVFSVKEKVEIATKLAEAGVDQIEAVIPAMGGDEVKAIKEIVKLHLPSNILVWNRALIKDINRSLNCNTIGICNPLQVYKTITDLSKKINIPVEIHMHNDFGMATANSLMVIEGGATF